MTGVRDERIPIDPAGVRQLLNDLAVARVTFQLRAISAVIGAAQPVVTKCPICDRSNPCPLHTFSDQCDHRRAHP